MTQEQVKGKLDLLFNNVRVYRHSKNFMDLMRFCSHFKTLAPYNAMLVRFQLPGATYVLTAGEWERLYDRGISPNAQPLVVLFPFGPVDFVFEIKDTYQLYRDRKKYRTNEEILQEIQKPFKTEGKIRREIFENLIDNLPFHSIDFDPDWNAASNMGAKIQKLDSPSNEIRVVIKRGYPPITCKADYLLSTNVQGSPEETFGGMVHELGHFFCYHLEAPEDWLKANKKPWKVRKLSHEAKEFEAECVAWLICERLEIKHPAEKYLSLYANEDDDKMIPDGVSIERIFTAFNKVWDMCSRDNFPCQDGLLYKYKKEFQNRVKQELEKYK